MQDIVLQIGGANFLYSKLLLFKGDITPLRGGITENVFKEGVIWENGDFLSWGNRLL